MKRSVSFVGRSVAPLAAAMSALALLMLVPAAAAVAAAAEYPVRPVRLVNPFPPGGSSDPFARLLAEALGRALGQPVIVDNRGGGNGNIGTALVSKAVPDGHTLLFASGTTFTVNPSVYRSQGFDPARDFEPVAMVGSIPNVLVVHPSLPARTLAEFTQYVKGRNGELNYASAGNGSSMHLAGELFQSMTGTKMQHVPFVSPGQATQDTLANRTQLIFHLVAAVAPQVQAGSLRAIAVLAPARSGVLPDVPTTREAGMPGLEAGTWYAVFVPRGTPTAVVTRLNGAINRILDEPAFRKRVTELGLTVETGPPAAITERIRREAPRWAELAKALSLRLD
ncbi:MAG: tripartite tricarboxylate transporter substrate binding protein [bacterium]|jgi:tripartite-type tricarboxylate transporter receptor subunit TctC|nr:tripartite tricarboxylate transporter substrate binding protein [Betaproteobacteria bacterium]